MGDGVGSPFEVGGPISRLVTRWKVIFPDFKEYHEILNLLGAPSQVPMTCFALQASQILRDLDKVARSLSRSPDLWIRSLVRLAGRWVF
jgi:hypothetical protein